MEAERNIGVRIGYDGTEFYGWQIQGRGRTVQGEVEQALGRLHRHTVKITAAGRTDSGVHARGQAGNFYSDLHSIPEDKFASALNSLLPRDIRIYHSRQVSHSFHATRDAIDRCYRYYLYSGRYADPLLDRYRLRVASLPPINELNRMASMLVGTHDYTSLASPKHEASMVRTVYQAGFFPDQHGLVFEISGAGFLWKMVRTVIGTMLALVERPRAVEEFQRVFHGRNRALAGKTAPPHGLVLHRVRYEELQ